MTLRRSSAERHTLDQPLAETDPGNDSDGHDLVFDELMPTQTGLSYQEKKHIFFLFCLYFIHAVPLSFSWATMPILLRQQLPYGQIGTFLIAQYPYSIKVAWSPIVEAVYNSKLGRRKTWVVPGFVIGGILQFWLGFKQDLLVNSIADGDSFAMFLLVIAWFALMFMMSTVRIALDAWSLDLLSPQNVHWASSAAGVGEIAAQFVAFNLFLGIASLGSHQRTKNNSEVVSTWFFYTFWATAFIALAVGLFLFSHEPSDHKNPVKRSIGASYKIIWNVLKLPQVWTLMLIHMTSIIGFQTNDSISVLQLVKYNFSDRDIAAIATISFPFEVLVGIFISKTFTKHHPLKVWRRLFPWRLINAFVSQLAVLAISKYRDSHYRFLIAVIPGCLSRFLETAMFVALVAFHAQVSDPRYGGIYMALLATTLNIRYDSLNFIFTKTIGFLDGSEDFTKPTRLIDGYQIVNFLGVCIAVPLFIWFLRPALKRLQAIDPLQWRVATQEDDDQNKGYMMVQTRERTEDSDE